MDDYAGEAALTPQSASLMQGLDEYEEAAPLPTNSPIGASPPPFIPIVLCRESQRHAKVSVTYRSGDADRDDADTTLLLLPLLSPLFTPNVLVIQTGGVRKKNPLRWWRSGEKRRTWGWRVRIPVGSNIHH